jgi:hypothetical protein
VEKYVSADRSDHGTKRRMSITCCITIDTHSEFVILIVYANRLNITLYAHRILLISTTYKITYMYIDTLSNTIVLYEFRPDKGN